MKTIHEVHAALAPDKQEGNMKADVTAGFGFYPPTGHYVDGGSENTGKGMWTYEPFVGATLYLDDKKTVSLATNAFWEIHGTKKDSEPGLANIKGAASSPSGRT